MRKKLLSSLAAASLALCTLLPANVHAANGQADNWNTFKIELECTDDAGGWNSSTIPVDLIDSAGKTYRWDVSCKSLDDTGKKVSRTFELGTARPVALKVYPDFGGGLTARSFGLKARTWIQVSTTTRKFVEEYVTNKASIRSYPFTSSLNNNDYMYLTFGGYGMGTDGSYYESKEGYFELEVGSYDVEGNDSNYKDEWKRTQRDAKDKTVFIQLRSPWVLDACLTVGDIGSQQLSGKHVVLDLNGYPIIRALRNNADSGCLFKVDNGNILTIIDSNPESSTYTNITGGSIQGGKSKSGGGLIEVGQKGTFNMRGGTLYDGRTDISGGAIRNLGNMNLENVRITGCKAEGSTVQDDDGGAIYSSGTATLKNCTIDNCKSYDYGGAIIVDGGNMTLEQVQITNCSTDDNEGGAIYVTGGGTLRYAGGTVKNCSAKKDDGGAIYQNKGTVTCSNVIFENNTSKKSGGAVYVNVSDEAAEFNNCTFNGNRAEDEGGAIYINKVSDKHCIIRDSSIQGNTSYGNGGGLYVNYNYVTLHNCTVKENQTGQNKKGGGVYLNGGYTLGLQGKMEVLNNKVGDKTDNLYVVSGAQITNGGLYDGSEIHLTPSKSSKYKVANLSTAQIQYFKVDSGSMTMENVTTQRERFVSSAIGEGSIIAILVGLMLMILIVGVVLSIKSRKTH